MIFQALRRHWFIANFFLIKCNKIKDNFSLHLRMKAIKIRSFGFIFVVCPNLQLARKRKYVKSNLSIANPYQATLHDPTSVALNMARIWHKGTLKKWYAEVRRYILIGGPCHQLNALQINGEQCYAVGVFNILVPLKN